MKDARLPLDTGVWDYMVAWAGNVGCVLAARLSESASQRVLLPEAGPPDVVLMKPFGLGYYFDLSRFECGY